MEAMPKKRGYFRYFLRKIIGFRSTISLSVSLGRAGMEIDSAWLSKHSTIVCKSTLWSLINVQVLGKKMGYEL